MKRTANILGVILMASASSVAAQTSKTAEPAPTKALPAEGLASDWPQWRGPNRDGVAPASPKLLDRWPKDGPPLLWKSDFIPAYRDGGCGGPVVADGKVFIFANKQPIDGGRSFKYITAKTLEQLKKQDIPPADLERLSKLQGVGHTTVADWAAEFRNIKGYGIAHHIAISQPLRALWEQSFDWSDTVYCLDAATGKEIWKKSFPVDKAILKNPSVVVSWWTFDNLGVCTTPAVWGGKCYAVGSMGLYCLSVKDGSLLWHIKSGPEHASPLVADGIVYHLGRAYDAETGKVRWKNPTWVLGDGQHKRDEWTARYSSPVLWSSAGKRCVITTDGGDENKTSHVCLDLQTGKLLWTVKIGIALNPIVHDDILVAPRGVNMPLSNAYKLTSSGSELFWKGRFNSCSWGGLAYREHVYGEHETQFCASLKTGEVNWKRTTDVICPQIAADGKIFGCAADCSSESVPVAMFKATAEKYEELGRFNPQACIMCQPALADGKMYVRLKDCVACYDVQEHGLYLDGVTAMKESLLFRFKQSGGGLKGKLGLKDVQITDASGVAKPALAKVDGENILVDIKNVSLPFAISCAGSKSLAGLNGKPIPSFVWNEARLLKFRKAVDQTVVLKSDIPLQQVGPWDQIGTFSIEGAKVLKVNLDPQGSAVRLTTDKSWKPGDTMTLTYPCFAVDRGEPRRETIAVKVVEVQPAAAAFVKTDTTTSGDWKGKYGVDGAIVAGDKGTTQKPKCAVVGLRHQREDVPWAASPNQPFRMQLTGNQPGRSVVHWRSGDQMCLDVDITDGKEHQVAVYIAMGCPLTFEVVDSDSKTVLDTQSVDQHPKGEVGNRYLAWNIKGSVTIHVTNAADAHGNQLWIGGLFFDPAAPKLGGNLEKEKPGAARNWPGFRGAGHAGVSPNTDIPSSFDVVSGRNILWRVDAPSGTSAPIVWGDKLFLSASDGKVDELYCLDADSGKMIWNQTLPCNGETPTVHEDLGFAGPTPVTDGERVYAVYASGSLVGFDFSGNKIWSKIIGPLRTTYGYASSPVLAGKLLILQLDRGDKERSQLLAIDAASGREVWRKSRQIDDSWTTPFVVRHQSRELIVTTAAHQAIAYDAKDGAVVWSANGLGREKAVSPICAGGMAFLILDTEQMAAIALNSAGKAKPKWLTTDGTIPDVSSPVTDGKQIFVVDPSGTLQCFDAANGKQVWQRDLDESFYSSPSLVGDRLFLFSRGDSSTMFVVPAAAGDKPIIKSELKDRCLACPAFQSGRMYIRTAKSLFCIGEKKK